MAESLEGKVVAITGGASGLGLATAIMAASRGASLVLGDLDEMGLETAAAKVGAAGGDVRTTRVDVRDPDDSARLAALAQKEFGRLDGAMTSAGIDNNVSALEMTLEQWNHLLSINLTGTFLTAQAVARSMVEKGSKGSIVTVASGIGVRGRATGAHYTAAKAGVIGVTKALALAVARNGVRVNCVAPGISDTPMARSVMTEEEMQARGNQIPMGRYGTADDIANVVCFLLSDNSGWLTGQTIHANGGALMP
jgi:NAD(P)-dependent dehydrogenase (short-subunit alcohol dehydrogenase family)